MSNVVQSALKSDLYPVKLPHNSPNQAGSTTTASIKLLRTRIIIEGLQLFCRHGMLEEERSLGQWFSFDVNANLSDGAAHADDALLDSVGYHDLIETVHQFATQNICDTLERLSCRLAECIFGAYDAIDGLTIRVRAVAPPIKAVTSSVSVEIVAERVRAR
jgi:dihydroneopterin aldolase